MTRKILGLDPGPRQTGYVLYIPDWKNLGMETCYESVGVANSEEICERIWMEWCDAELFAYEMFMNYGKPINEDSIRTITETGRFIERWCQTSHPKDTAIPIWRKSVLAHHGVNGNQKGADTYLRAALCTSFGVPVGATGKKLGPLHGVSSHAWSALAVAIAVEEGARSVHKDGRPLITW